MDRVETKNRLDRVINTLNATKLRVDQEEAMMRIRACVEELRTAAEELSDDEDNDKRGQDV